MNHPFSAGPAKSAAKLRHVQVVGDLEGGEGMLFHWKLHGDRIGQVLTALHGRLAGLRRDLPALRSPSMYPYQWETWQTRFNPSVSAWTSNASS